MPAIITCKDRRCEQHWNVGSDDFVVPGVVAVVLGLFNLTLISSGLVVLYFTPSDLPNFCPNITSYSPLLYVPLFSMAAVEVSFILNEGLIIIVSAQGPIFKKTKSFVFRQKFMPHLIYLRIFLAVLELLTIIASLVAIFHPLAVSNIEKCDKLEVHLSFARAVVFFQVICYALFLLKVCIYTDPLGCFTPGLLERITLLDSSDGRDSLLIPTEHFMEESTNSILRKHVSVDKWSAAAEVNVWRHKKVLDIQGADIERATKIHNDSINRQKYERKLRALFCCLGIKGHRARGVALEDAARGLYTVFSDTDIVLSDVIAGFSLLREHQLQRMKEGGELALTRKFRMVTFEMMPPLQRCVVDPTTLREDHPFEFTDVDNQLLFEDLEHYMHYAMGVYGWPLHVFDNLCCGVCQLCTVTCCRFQCLNSRARNRDFNSDNCCMCGVGTFRLRTGIEERDILYVNFQNKIFLAPFIVCLDHAMKSIVICIRGTLSLKDTLTDMSFSPIGRPVSGVKETYIHGGMYRAAQRILNIIRKKEILQKAIKDYQGYQLVVTGHSLGAGVASILALLLKQKMKLSDEMLKCYAFSPPGALFSFPLAEYTKSFITSVVLGNDIVPRLSMRALLHLKFTVKHLLANSEIPKYKILCRSRTCATLCQCYDKSKDIARETASSIRRSSRSSSSSRPSRRENRDDSVTTQESHYEDAQSVVTLEHVSVDMEGTGQFKNGDASRVVSDGAAVLRRGRRGRVLLERDDSIEWKVFADPSTASIRRKLFERTASIQPSSLPVNRTTIRQKLARVISHTPHHRQTSISHSLAAQIKEAVSLDLAEEEIPEGLIQGTEATPISARRVEADSLGGRSTQRQLSDALIIDAMPVIGEECRVDETKTFTPFFLPGRVLHIKQQKTSTYCGVEEMEVMEVNRENMCVILIDHGIVDDHLPNHVSSALKTCKSRLMRSPATYNKPVIKELREQRQRHLQQAWKIRLAHEKSMELNPDKKKFVFAGVSPTEELPGTSAERNAKRYNVSDLRRQENFDVPMSNLSTTSALEVPAQRLSRISEFTDEDGASTQELIVKAGVINDSPEHEDVKTLELEDVKMPELEVVVKNPELALRVETENRLTPESANEAAAAVHEVSGDPADIASPKSEVALTIETDESKLSSEISSTRFNSETQNNSSTESEVTSQFQDPTWQACNTSLPLGCFIDIPLSNMSPTSATTLSPTMTSPAIMLPPTSDTILPAAATGESIFSTSARDDGFAVGKLPGLHSAEFRQRP